MDMDLEQKAIMRLREAADTSERFYKAPLIVTTSGGKDSSVAAFPVSGASGVLWRERKADKRSLAAIRNTKTHISALSIRCSRSGNAEGKCKAHGERERQAATFSIGGWRTGYSPDKWSSTTSYQRRTRNGRR